MLRSLSRSASSFASTSKRSGSTSAGSESQSSPQSPRRFTLVAAKDELQEELSRMRADLIAAKLQIAMLSSENGELKHQLRRVTRELRASNKSSSLSLLPLDDEPPTTEVEPARVARAVNSVEDVQSIVAVLTPHRTFAGFSPDALERVASAMVALDYGPGEIVIRQGQSDEDQFFFIVSTGEYSVVIADELSPSLGVANGSAAKLTYTAGGSFGELALRYGNERKATIRCDVGGTLWALARDDYLRLRPGSG